MPGSFYCQDGDMEQIFVSDYATIDQFAATGSLWAWGYNNYGQSGTNSSGGSTRSPVQTISSGTNWKQIACGYAHAAAIKTDGTFWNWGRGTQAQLGDNTSLSKPSPVQTISGGTNWLTASAGGNNTGAIKTDGTLWMWGNNSYGQIGDNTITGKSSPVQTIASGNNWKQLSIGNVLVSAIKWDGSLWIWGKNSYGSLGDNTITRKSSPIQTVAGGTNWKQVSCGYGHTAAIKTNGTLWTWGCNSYGQLGDTTIAHKSSPIQTIAGGTNWKQVASSPGGSNLAYTAAIKTDGTLWSWGVNTYGQLGDNTNSNAKSSPVQTISGGTNWKQVSTSQYTTLAIKTDGTLWAFGYNSFAGIGDNTTIGKSSPVQTISGGTNWKQVAGGGYFTEAIYFYDAGLPLYPNS